MPDKKKNEVAKLLLETVPPRNEMNLGQILHVAAHAIPFRRGVVLKSRFLAGFERAPRGDMRRFDDALRAFVFFRERANV